MKVCRLFALLLPIALIAGIEKLAAVAGPAHLAAPVQEVQPTKELPGAIRVRVKLLIMPIVSGKGTIQIPGFMFASVVLRSLDAAISASSRGPVGRSERDDGRNTSNGSRCILHFRSSFPQLTTTRA